MYPASRASPPTERIAPPAAKRIANESNVPTPRVLLSDEVLIMNLTHRYPALTSPQIGRRHAVAQAEFHVICDVPQEEIGVSIVRPGEALITTGVRPCYAICARSTTHDGETIVGIHHTAFTLRSQSIGETAHRRLQPLLEMMRRRGAVGPLQMFIVGGEVSRLEQRPEFRADPTEAVPEDLGTGTVQEGECLMRAAAELLVAARIGLSDSEGEEYPGELEDDDEIAHQGIELKPASGRPEAVSVFMTHNEVFYVRQEDDHSVAPDLEGNPALDPEDSDEGDMPDLCEIEIESDADAEIGAHAELDDQVQAVVMHQPDAT